MSKVMIFKQMAEKLKFGDFAEIDASGKLKLRAIELGEGEVNVFLYWLSDCYADKPGARIPDVTLEGKHRGRGRPRKKDKNEEDTTRR